jgi:hypothetical protein
MTEEVKKTPKFSSRDFGVASFKRNEWRLDLTDAHALSDVENSRLWGDILGKVVRGDTVEAFKPDSGEWARFVVAEVGPGFIKLGRTESYTPAEVVIPAGALGVKWNVGKRSFDVKREADGFVMSGGFQTKASAAAWIEDHNKKMAA